MKDYSIRIKTASSIPRLNSISSHFCPMKQFRFCVINISCLLIGYFLVLDSTDRVTRNIGYMFFPNQSGGRKLRSAISLSQPDWIVTSRWCNSVPPNEEFKDRLLMFMYFLPNFRVKLYFLNKNFLRQSSFIWLRF